ncbi:histidinol-phosphate transaminase [Bacillus sp. CGMCC 1.16607]|uniref:histidinol-phosphate transaminase n=1 Tax=Bacillus sp. CGMCC 1.16607 TaxID=3351842 RepID=UPI003630FEBB
MKIKQQLHSLKPYQPGKSIEAVKKQFGLEKIIKLASNENPYGSSPNVKKAIIQMDVPYSLYPDGLASPLRISMANFLNVNPDQLMFGNGSDEIIRIISRSLLHKECNTVMATPTFPQYKHNAIIEGAEIREVSLINGEHDLSNMLQAIDEKTNVVWLCSPNNPTGTYIKKDQIISFLDQVPKHVLVVLDEAYYEYVHEPDYYHSHEFIHLYENLVILRTFSKIYGLAGFRLGYCIGNSVIIKGLEPSREPFNVNALAQIAGETALKDQNFVEQCNKANQEGLQQFYQFCKKNELHYFPSQGNFILIDFNQDGDEVFQYLLERGYIVRSGKGLGFPTSVRITIGLKEQNEGLIQVLGTFLEQRETIVENTLV